MSDFVAGCLGGENKKQELTGVVLFQFHFLFIRLLCFPSVSVSFAEIWKGAGRFGT